MASHTGIKNFCAPTVVKNDKTRGNLKHKHSHMTCIYIVHFIQDANPLNQIERPVNVQYMAVKTINFNRWLICTICPQVHDSLANNTSTESFIVINPVRCSYWMILNLIKVIFLHATNCHIKLLFNKNLLTLKALITSEIPERVTQKIDIEIQIWIMQPP
jgi:hypothetical protein